MFTYVLVPSHEIQGRFTSRRFRGEAVDKLRDFDRDIARPLGLKIKRLRSENGQEYAGNHYWDFCKEPGIMQEFSAPFNPQQNGLSERDGRTIMAVARCLQNEARLPRYLWSEICGRAVYLTNRIPHRSISMQAPYYKMYGKHSRISRICVSSDLRAFVHIEEHKDNIKERAWEGRLIRLQHRRLNIPDLSSE